MKILKTLLCAGLVFAFSSVDASAQTKTSISEQAAKILAKKNKKQQLEKNDLKTDQQIEQLGNLTIEQFLMLKPVPEGLDVASSANMANESEVYKNMDVDDAAASVSIMRSQGIDMPKDLEKQIRKNPKKAAELMGNAMKKIKPLDVKTLQDVAKYRRAAIQKAEESTGVDFRYLLNMQKRQMYTEDFQ